MDGTDLEKTVAAARAYDPGAIAALCNHFYPRLYRFALSRLARREDAEDLASEVCVRVVGALPEQKGFFPAWVFRIATNLIADFYRRRGTGQEVALSDEVAESVPDPKAAVSDLVLPHQLARALDKLTPEQREVIHLRFTEGFDTSEVADIQGRSVGAVRALQFRALEALRQTLAPQTGGNHGA